MWQSITFVDGKKINYNLYASSTQDKFMGWLILRVWLTGTLSMVVNRDLDRSIAQIYDPNSPKRLGSCYDCKNCRIVYDHIEL